MSVFPFRPTGFELEERRAFEAGISEAESDMRAAYEVAAVAAKALAGIESASQSAYNIYRGLRDLVEDTITPEYGKEIDCRAISEDVWAKAQAPDFFEVAKAICRPPSLSEGRD